MGELWEVCWACARPVMLLGAGEHGCFECFAARTLFPACLSASFASGEFGLYLSGDSDGSRCGEVLLHLQEGGELFGDFCFCNVLSMPGGAQFKRVLLSFSLLRNHCVFEGETPMFNESVPFEELRSESVGGGARLSCRLLLPRRRQLAQLPL